MNLGGAIHLNKTGIVIFCAILVLLYFYLFSNNSARLDEDVNLRTVLEAALKAAENGGREVVLTKDDLQIKSKGLTKEGAEDSVTTADFLSHCSMIATLKHHFPQLKVISEEAKTECDSKQVVDFQFSASQNVPDQFVSAKDVTIWIDPLDATHEYTEKLYDYVTTMVCIAVKGQPIIGVIYRPFSKETLWAWVGKAHSSDLVNEASWPARDKVKVAISRTHKGRIEQVLENNLKNYEVVVAAGAGYKALEVATRKVDAYLHITAIKKWDICAGNAIINALGGRMTNKLDEVISYGDELDVVNENGLIATLRNHHLFLGKL